MKTLFLVRHAKSSWEDAALADHDRPLADRGERDVAKMAKRLAARDVKPDLIMSSPAVRALATADVIATRLGGKHEDVVVNDRLYGSEADELLEVLHQLGGKLKRVMMVGHNPALTELAYRLANEITHLPTCAVAEFRFDTKSWSDIGKAKPEYVALDCPKKPSGK